MMMSFEFLGANESCGAFCAMLDSYANLPHPHRIL